MRTFFEFFAGGGMARMGLGDGWTCLLANDIDRGKAMSCARNFGDDRLRVCDVADLTTADLPSPPRAGPVDLAWASPPCQDVSEAGPRIGLHGGRSGAFWPFWRLIEGLVAEGRAPRVVVVENVVGLLKSNRGADIAAIRNAFEREGYDHATTVIDARHFVPQSRPRVFVVGARHEPEADLASLVQAAMQALPRRNELMFPRANGGHGRKSSGILR
jgi:DNA (cytosine-5)-methyltransferase 1